MADSSGNSHESNTALQVGYDRPHDNAPRVFDRFYRAAESHSCTGGSGFGLAIVAAVVGAHGARIQGPTAD
ncbi:ATP-binding protein [Nocardia sp. NBC_00403]|uniref:ATP-binding protein n=1 Tax=Nocardia sp. NBC_00403 TaxID=2975990 RepID=UPI002E202836